MKLTERLRIEADNTNCVPLTPLLHASADQIERLELLLDETREELSKLKGERPTILTSVIRKVFGD